MGRSGTSRWNIREVRDGSGDPRETRGEVLDWSGYPRGRTGTGRGTIHVVRGR